MPAQTDHPLAARSAQQKHAAHLVSMLAVQFLIGMAVNLIGMPSETHGLTRTLVSVLIGVHVLVAVGLGVGAVQVLLAAIRTAGDRSLPVAGAAGVGLALGAGVVTMITNSSWASYLMAVGFLVALLSYGRLMAALPRPGTSSS